MSPRPQIKIRKLCSPQRCSFCHDGLGPVSWHCPDCQGVLHRECLQELVVCPSLGCNRRLEESSSPGTGRPRRSYRNRVSGLSGRGFSYYDEGDRQSIHIPSPSLLPELSLLGQSFLCLGGGLLWFGIVTGLWLLCLLGLVIGLFVLGRSLLSEMGNEELIFDEHWIWSVRYGFPPDSRPLHYQSIGSVFLQDRPSGLEDLFKSRPGEYPHPTIMETDSGKVSFGRHLQSDDKERLIMLIRRIVSLKKKGQEISPEVLLGEEGIELQPSHRLVRNSELLSSTQTRSS